MHWNGHSMSLWWMLIIPSLIALVWYAIWATFWLPHRRRSRESPEEMLKRAYTNGEMNRETYQRMLADLRK